MSPSSVRWRRWGGSRRQERAVCRQGVEEGEQRRDCLLERLVQCEDLSGHLGADGAGVITLLDVAIALQEVNHGEIRRCLAIRYRGTFEHQPALRAMRVHHLVYQPGLPNTGLAHQRHHLAVPSLRLYQGLLQGFQLMLPPHEAGEAAGRSCLQPRPHHTGAHHLVDLHRVTQAPDWHDSQRLDLHKALDQPQYRRRDQDRARHGHLLHAGRQVRCLPHRRVVHVQVAADRSHHHLASVQPDTHVDGYPMAALHLSGILLDGLLHT